MRQSIWIGVGVAAIVATAAACGSSAPATPTTPTASTPTPTPAPGPLPAPVELATITIGANGQVSPSTVVVTRGGRVTMVNNDSRSHDMASDPHPEHSTCTELNQIGFLTSGQSRTSGNLNTARTCTYHDHNLPDAAGLKGTIIIQ